MSEEFPKEIWVHDGMYDDHTWFEAMPNSTAMKGGVKYIRADLAPSPSVRELVERAQFLLDRLGEYEPDHHDHARDYYGHVEPGIERLRTALSRYAGVK